LTYDESMYPHRIRLRGPWEHAAAGQEPIRTTVPCRLTEEALAHGPVVLSRKFGYPGRLDPHENVWLILNGIDGSARLSLNGQDLGKTDAAAFAGEVTAYLRQHNRLEITLAGLALGECYLEIRAPAYLEEVDLSRSPSGKLHVAGSVAGSADRQLDLYILADGKQAFYRSIAVGESFAADMEDKAQKVRVELVDAATVWYVVELIPPNIMGYRQSK
jgi:hypothetical protein